MIPKIVHYCWFGRNPLPELARKCIASWKKYLPDYEIKEWNEDNFNVNIIQYTEEAYRAKKYAFVSDYARFWILFHIGGVYFDTDVELIRPMDDIILKGAFMGCEREAGNGVDKLYVAPGLGIGANPGLDLYNEILEFYSNLSYVKECEKGSETVVKYTTRILCKYGLQDLNDIQNVAGVEIYPKEYFCPKDYVTGKIKITDKTVSIHHYGASWLPFNERIEHRFWQMLGLTPHRFMWHFNRLLNNFFNICPD